MIGRSVSLDIPDRYPWFKVSLDGDVHTFRVPSLGRVASIQNDIASAFEAQDFGALEAHLGDFIAVIWAHPELQLDEPEDGHGVYEQLRDGGWTFAALISLYEHTAQLMQAELISESEVAAKVDFIEVRARVGEVRSISA